MSCRSVANSPSWTAQAPACRDLFIIKSELPLVIGTFLYMDPEG